VVAGDHCTVNVKVPVWVWCPAVAVTVMVLVLVGVFWPQLSIFRPGKIEVPSLAAGGLTVNEYESGVGLTILSHNRNELPAAPESAILYEANLLMTILIVHVLRATAVFETADARDFRKVISACSYLM
jgi:hypothetical protein